MLVVTVLTGMNPVSLLFSGPMAILGVVMTVINYNHQSKAFSKREALRAEKYEQYLARCEERLKAFAAEQREIALSGNPEPEDCFRFAAELSSGLWMRSPGDPDFLSLRVGTGEEPLTMTVKTPKLGVVLEEDAFTRRPEALAKKYQLVSGIPAAAELFRCSSAGLVGGRGQLLNTIRCMVLQLAALHSYEDVKLAVIFPKEEYEEWAWMRWLPHTFNDSRSTRYMACGAFEASQLLKHLNEACRGRKKETTEPFGKTVPAIPHYVVIVGAPELLKGAEKLFETPGVSSIWLSYSVAALPQGVEQILEFGSRAEIYMRCRASERKTFRPDQAAQKRCEAFARSLAPVRLAGGKKAGLPDSVSFLEGYRVSKVDQLDIGDFWQNARCEKTLSVPIGVRENGENYYFDIHETKDGPHGLAAGTSGSGKSEMAQSWIASMALQFSPEDVNFILVDFKGTSLLQPFKELPHLAGSISNLDTDIGRCLLALESEMERRQRVFDEAGVNNICEYLTKRRKTRNMEKMPFLILVIDEFAEFKAQFPDFTGPLNHVFRGGRSLGVYTVIMTQKPSGVVTDQMNANANFRWCLKVQSESDSRDMLGIPDAAFLTVPGRSYVRSGEGTVELIQPFYSGADYQPGAQKRQIPPVCAVSLLGERTPLGNPHSNQEAPKKKQIDAVVQAISDYCRRMGIAPASQLWTKPLEERLELAKVLPSGRLWEQSSDWKELMEGAQAVFGMVDDPMHQRQVPLCHDFWKQGNLLVYGMTLSGKTTFLKSLLISMCCTYSPAQVQFYLMEFTGFGLRSLETFPHVGGAAGDDEPENLARIGEKLLEELGRRKKLFRKAGVGTISSYEDAAGESLPTIILLADTLNLAGTKFPGLQGQIIQLAREGEAFGLYIAAAVTGGSGLSYQLTENFKTVMTLQLTDRLDYTQLVGRVSGNIPKPVIGRGLVRGPLEFQTAIAGEELTDGQRIAMLRDLAGRMSASWKGPLPDRIRSVPETVPYGSLKGEPLILGVRYGDGETASLPVREATSLLISCGSRESGEEVLALLYRQAREMEDARIYGYGQEMDPPALGGVLGKPGRGPGQKDLLFLRFFRRGFGGRFRRFFCRRDHKDERGTAGADVGADDRAELGGAPTGQATVLVQVAVHRRDGALIVGIQQHIAIGRVDAAELVDLLEHGHQRAGAAAGGIGQLDLAVHDREHRLDAQRPAHQRDGGGQAAALVQVLEAVDDAEDADAPLEFFQRRGDLGGAAAFLVAQAHGLAHKDRFALGAGAGVHKVEVFKLAGLGGQARALPGAGQRGGQQHGHDRVARGARVLKNFDELVRRGLAGARQLVLGFQAGIVFVAGDVNAVQRGIPVGKVHLQRDDCHAGQRRIGTGQVGGGIGQDTNHRAGPRFSARAVFLILTQNCILSKFIRASPAY